MDGCNAIARTDQANSKVSYIHVAKVAKLNFAKLRDSLIGSVL